MQPFPRPFVKVCCIGSVEEAWLAIRHGASAVGLVAEMPSGPGVVTEDLIRDVGARVPPPVATFLLTSHQDPEAIVAQQRRARVNTIQVCDRLPERSYERLRAALPGISLVQVVHVTGPESVDEAIAIAPEVDAILLDSGNPSLPVKELGGTGRVHDWALSARIREAVPVPVFLAGGLKPGNVGEAIRRVRPFGVDLCSGIRRDGALAEDLLAEFFRAIDEAVAGRPAAAALTG